MKQNICARLGVSIQKSFLLLTCLLSGCHPAVSIQNTPTSAETEKAQAASAAPTLAQTVTLTPTRFPTPTPTPTYVPWFYPSPTPVVFPNNWTLSYLAEVIEDPKDPFSYVHWEIHTIQLNGKESVRWAQSVRSTYNPKWSPDGKRLAFTNVQNPAYLYILDRVSGHMDEIKNVGEFTWSRDGQRIFYCDDPNQFQGPPFHCYLVDVAQPVRSRKVLTEGDWYAVQLFWSPIEDKILAVVDHWAGVREIFIIRLDGQVEQIHTKLKAAWAVWHPGGEKIGYGVSYIWGEAREKDLRTLEEKQLTHTNKLVEKMAWSPDGANLAYISWEKSQPNPAPAELSILNLATGEITLVSQSGLTAYSVSWSPDGAYLAYMESTGDNRDVCRIEIYQVQAGISSKLAPNDVDCYVPAAWLPSP